MSHPKKMPANAKYIGILSRFGNNKNIIESECFDVTILLSGPEPQRTLFENKCLDLLNGQNKKCCFIRGLPGSAEKKENSRKMTWFNHLGDDDLKSVLLHSKNVVCRSGYSSIMDLVELDIKAMLVPTPGQTEQEYLAVYNKENAQFEIRDEDSLTSKDLLGELCLQNN